MSTTFSQQVLLNAVTGTGAGTAFDLVRPHRNFTFEKIANGPFSVLVVNYEGSVNGLTWFQIGTDNTLVSAPTFVVDKICRYVRASVATFTGGTNVSVNCLAGE